MQKSRIVSIDILKVIATILVINSHMEICYAPYEVLATGGAIGDALFFFCSGFTILIGRNRTFLNYYKRRVNRIYPTVFVVAIITELIYGSHNSFVGIITSGGGWFVSCIMIYYVFLYFVKIFFMSQLRIALFSSVFISVVSYYLFFDNKGEFSMYGNTYYKWVFNFIFMLFGGIIGYNHNKVKFAGLFDVIMLIISIVSYYIIPIMSSVFPILIDIQYITLVSLIGCCYYFYKLCDSVLLVKIYNHHIWGQVVYICGGVCLEAYLIQSYLFTNKLNAIFPLNILIIMIVIIFISYIIKVISNFYLQTFQERDYNWSLMLLWKR